ncbi:MAG: DNA alkylation repair protein [Bacteroidota bacterium]
MSCNIDNIVMKLEQMRNPVNIAGMARFGISTDTALGVPMPVIRKLAKEIKRDHELALQLWRSGIHEARILAALIDDPAKVTAGQMEDWVLDFNSWDLCDQCCMNLFDKTADAYDKATEWCYREEEFVKRAGFVIMAAMAVHNKKAEDELFISFFPFLLQGASDERNFARKAVNWALRQIGKRNMRLNGLVLQLSEEILSAYNSPKSRWIAKDAIRELKDPKILKRIK